VEIVAGLEIGDNRQVPLIFNFSKECSYDSALALYKAREWAKVAPVYTRDNPLFRGIEPHKRFKHISILDNEDIDYISILNSTNKIEVPYGCWNRYIKEELCIKNGYDVDGKMTFKYIPNVMSTDCAYTKENPDDPRCSKCCHNFYCK
jgi:hypothetical protein